MIIFFSSASVSNDEKYLKLYIERGNENINGFWYAELQPMIENKMSTSPKWCRLFNNFDASYDVIILCFIFMNNL